MSNASMVSIVVPIYNEAEGLHYLIEELSKLDTNRWGDTFEFLLVDDGSSDGTWQLLEEWADQDPRVTLVRLAGNRGPSRATRAGIEAAVGDVITWLPADLQEGTDLIDAVLEKWHENHRIVMLVAESGRVYDKKRDATFANLFYWILKLNSRIYGDLPVRANLKLMDRITARHYCENTSCNTLRTPFVLWNRFPYDVVYYEVKERKAGRSKWSFHSKVSLMADQFVETAAWMLSPWRIAVAGGLLYVILRLAAVIAPWGQTFWIALADICQVGFVLLVASILGIYVSRIHQEVRGAGPYLVRELRRGAVNVKWKTERTGIEH